MNLAQKLDLAHGRPTGFDYMRLILGFSVLWMHTARVSYGSDAFLWDTPLRPFLKIILPMFFILSGFLVAGSLERSKTLISFLGNRFIRIYPALAVEVVLSAFVLGPIYTAYELSSYFSDRTFFEYLLNVTGHIHYYLPGVFLDNPDPRIVYAQLWTVPFELKCYFAITVLFLFRVTRRRFIAPLAAVGFLAATCINRYFKYGTDWAVIPNVMPGNLLIAAFLFGVAVFLYKDRIVWSWWLFWVSVVFSLCSFWFTSIGDLIAIPAITYMTVFLGLASPAKVAILRGADYSYGIFLYGFVIQQAFAGLGSWTHNWFLNGMVCSVLAAAFAATSWYLVEKPSLRLKRPIVAFENAYLRFKNNLLGKKQATVTENP